MRRRLLGPSGHRASPQGALTAVAACAVFAAGCGGTGDPLALPEAKSSITSNSTEGGSTIAPTEPTGTDSTDADDPPDSQGADDNVSIGPNFIILDWFDFGPVPVGTSKTRRIELVNNTDWQRGTPGFAFTIVALPLTGDGFTLIPNHCIGVRLEVGDACQIAITFHPKDRGEYTSYLGLSTTPSVPSNAAAKFRGTGGLPSNPVGPPPGNLPVEGNSGNSGSPSPPSATPSDSPIGPSPSNPTAPTP